MRLAGKVALISGGARGMGAAEARLFGHEGARVVVGDILEAEGAAVVAEVMAKGGEAVFVRLDVTNESDWERAVAMAERRFGKLDVLVNNAGIGGAGRLEETTVADWDRVMDVNAKGVFLGTKAAIPALRRAGGGSIVNIPFQLGLVGVDGPVTPAMAAHRRGSGPDLVLFHGGMGSWKHWIRNVEPLATRFTVHALDHPAYGASAPVSRETTGAAYLDLVHDLFVEMFPGDSPLRLGGFSFGGAIAANLARR